MKKITCHEYRVPIETAVRWTASQIFAKATMESESGNYWIYATDYKEYGFKSKKAFASLMPEVVDCLNSDFSTQVCECYFVEEDEAIDLMLWLDYCVGSVDEEDDEIEYDD